MKYSELLGFYFDRSNALQWYWTIYVVVIGGLLAFSSLRQRPDFLTGILVTVLYVFFAYKNLGAIHDVTEQRLALLQAIKGYPAMEADASVVTPARQAIEPTLTPPDYPGVRNFHVAADLLTIAAVWAMERRRKRTARLTPAPPAP
jgi:hypothetical protein